MDIGLTDRLQVITDKLDKIHFCDKCTMAYMAFEDFYSYKRTAGVNMYEFLYQKLHKFRITLSEDVKAFLFWIQWNVSEEKAKSKARTTCITYT